MLLAIDTSSRHGGAALCDPAGSVREARLWRAAGSHTAQLLPAIAELLAAQDMDAGDLSGVAVALGPGPFSALRVGVSAAKGLALAAGIPIVGVDTLALEAHPHLAPDGIVGAWLEAGRREVAAAWFDGSGARVREDAIAAPSDLLGQEPALPSGALLYCGEAAIARRDDIRAYCGDAAGRRPAGVAPWNPALRLWALAAIAGGRLAQGDADDLAALQPYYLRMPTVGAPRQRDRVRQGRAPARAGNRPSTGSQSDGS